MMVCAVKAERTAPGRESLAACTKVVAVMREEGPIWALKQLVSVVLPEGRSE